MPARILLRTTSANRLKGAKKVQALESALRHNQESYYYQLPNPNTTSNRLTLKVVCLHKLFDTTL